MLSIFWQRFHEIVDTLLTWDWPGDNASKLSDFRKKTAWTIRHYLDTVLVGENLKKGEAVAYSEKNAKYTWVWRRLLECQTNLAWICFRCGEIPNPVLKFEHPRRWMTHVVPHHLTAIPQNDRPQDFITRRGIINAMRKKAECTLAEASKVGVVCSGTLTKLKNSSIAIDQSKTLQGRSQEFDLGGYKC